MRELPEQFKDGPNIDRFEILFPDVVEKWDKLNQDKEDKNEQDNTPRRKA